MRYPMGQRSKHTVGCEDSVRHGPAGSRCYMTRAGQDTQRCLQTPHKSSRRGTGRVWLLGLGWARPNSDGWAGPNICIQICNGQNHKSVCDTLYDLGLTWDSIRISRFPRLTLPPHHPPPLQAGVVTRRCTSSWCVRGAQVRCAPSCLVETGRPGRRGSP